MNISKDHKPIEETILLFDVLEKRSEISIKNGDYLELKDLKGKTFGLEKGNDIFPTTYETNAEGSSLEIDSTKFDLPHHGQHLRW